MVFNCFFLLFTLIFNSFNLFFKCFSKKRICKLSLYHYRSIILLWSEGNIFLLVRYSDLSILPHDIVDIFAVSLSISYHSFSYLILSSIVMTSFDIISKRLFLKQKGLSDGRVVSLTKKRICFCGTFFVKIHKIF